MAKPTAETSPLSLIKFEPTDDIKLSFDSFLPKSPSGSVISLTSEENDELKWPDENVRDESFFLYISLLTSPAEIC